MLDEQGKVTFNEQEQAEVNRIVQERLAREQSKYADHDDIKGIVEELQAFGYQGTPKEIKEVIKAQREEAQRQTELAELEKKAKDEGTTPALLAKIEKLEKELSELSGERQAQKQAAEQKKKADEAWNAQVKEMNESFPDIDLDALADDAKFKKFVKGKSGLTLKELYEDFVEFVGEAEAEAIAKSKSKQERSTGSGKGASSPGGGTHGLTDDEIRFVDDHNRRYPNMKMSYKEFSDRKKR